MADIITVLRIIFSIFIIFCPLFSVPFYIFYILSGITDVADGAVARKTGTESEFGSKLDTFADFVFLFVCLFKIYSMVFIPIWILIWIGFIAVIKIINVVSGYVLYKKFIAVHSLMNKVTGVILFVLPLTINYIDFRFSLPTVCSVATFAAVQEGHLIRTKSFIQ